jgi:hypothetical protein
VVVLAPEGPLVDHSAETINSYLVPFAATVVRTAKCLSGQPGKSQYIVVTALPRWAMAAEMSAGLLIGPDFQTEGNQATIHKWKP